MNRTYRFARVAKVKIVTKGLLKLKEHACLLEKTGGKGLQILITNRFTKVLIH